MIYNKNMKMHQKIVIKLKMIYNIKKIKGLKSMMNKTNYKQQQAKYKKSYNSKNQIQILFKIIYFRNKNKYKILI